MENTTKKYGKLLSFIPLISYVIWTGYFLSATGWNPGSSILTTALMTTLHNYSALFFGLAMICVVHATILLYFTIHLARIKDMTAGAKIMWMVFMVVVGAPALPVFWYSELRNEPMYIDVYPDIA